MKSTEFLFLICTYIGVLTAILAMRTINYNWVFIYAATAAAFLAFAADLAIF